MAFKLGLKNLIRQKGKTVSFFLLLMFVTLFLVLSVSMRVSCTELLENADNSFLTIATLDYRGANFPDDTHYDNNLNDMQKQLDYSALSDIDGVQSFEPYIRMRGFVGDYPVKNNKQYENVCVILFRVAGMYEGTNNCVLLKNYSGNNPLTPEGSRFSIDLSDFCASEKNCDEFIKINHYYIALGEFATVSNQSGFMYSHSSDKAFIPLIFSTHQISLSKQQLHCITNNGKDMKAYRFFYPEEAALKFDGIEPDYYKTLSENKKIRTPLIDVTKNPDVFSECFYDEEWVSKQPKLWRSLETAPDITKINWKNLLYAVTESYNVMSNSVDVVMTDNIEYIPDFHQSCTSLTDGSYYTAADGKNVCLISSALAYGLKLNVGDTLHLDLHNSAPFDENSNSYFYGSGFKYSGDFVIKGIYKLTGDMSDIVYIPNVQLENNATLSSLLTEPTMPSFVNSYRIGTFILDNKSAGTFSQSAKDKLPDKCILTVYDQGYVNVAAPLESMKNTSLLLICICVFTGLCIIMLFAYMFITKQKDTANTMLNLGTGNGKTLAYLIYGSVILTLCACITGALIGFFVSDKVLSLAYDWAAKNSIVDLSYSNLRTSLNEKIFNISFGKSLSVVSVTASAVILSAVITCLIFAYRIILIKNRSNAAKRLQKKKPSALKKTMASLHSTSETVAASHIAELKSNSKIKHSPSSRIKLIFKQSIRSAVRTPGRSLIVPTVSLAIIILISVFCGILQHYTDKTEQLYETVPVKGQFMNIGGTTNDGLLLTGAELEEFSKCGYIEKLEYAFSQICYNPLSYNPKGNDNHDDDIQLEELSNTYNGEYEYCPDSEFALERFIGKLVERPHMVFTTSIESAPEFYGFGIQKIEYAEGYDGSLFSGDERVCVVPRNLMDKCKEATLGLSTIKFSQTVRGNDGSFVLQACSYRIVGVINDITDKVYLPISLLKDSVVYFDSEDNSDNTSENTDTALSSYPCLTSCSFTLRSGYSVKPFRAYLSEKGFSYPAHIGMIRKCLVIDDRELQNTIDSLTKIKGYLEILYPVIYVIIIAIAFAVSYLLIRTRTTDIALMRSMGSGKGTTFFVMFAEQFALALIGIVIGTAIMQPIYGGISTLQLQSIILYALCYAIGLTIAICIINAVNVLKILSTKE